MLRLNRRMPFCKIATSPLGETWQLIPYQFTVQRLDTCCSQFAQQNQQLALRLPAHNLRTRRHACVCGHACSHGQGPQGGVPDVYTQKYTDQENHLLTTCVYICDHTLIIVITLMFFFSFYKILLDMLSKMCNTMYNWYI